MRKLSVLILIAPLLLAGCQEQEPSYSYSGKSDPSLVYFSTLKQAIKNELSQDSSGYVSTDFAGEASFISRGHILSKETVVSINAKKALLQFNHMNGTLEEMDGLYEINDLNFYMNNHKMVSHSATMGSYLDDSTFYYDVSAAKDFFEESGDSFQAILDEILGEETSSEPEDPEQEDFWSSLNIEIPEKGKIVGDSGSQFGALLALSPYLLMMEANDVVDGLKDDYDSKRTSFSLSHRNGVYTMEIAPDEEDYLETLISLAVDAYLVQEGGSIELGGITYTQKEIDDFLKKAFAWVDVDELWFRFQYQESGFLSWSFNFTLGFSDSLISNDTLGVITHLDSLKLSGSFQTLPEEEKTIVFPDFSEFEEIEFSIPEEWVSEVLTSEA